MQLSYADIFSFWLIYRLFSPPELPGEARLTRFCLMDFRLMSCFMLNVTHAILALGAIRFLLKSDAIRTPHSFL